jgi:hypothetical protein
MSPQDQLGSGRKRRSRRLARPSAAPCVHGSSTGRVDDGPGAGCGGVGEPRSRNGARGRCDHRCRVCGSRRSSHYRLRDWSETSGRSRRTGLVHGLLNIAAPTLYANAYMLRKNGSRSSGQTCALAGYSIAIGTAWFGGDLVYGQRIGVTHAAIDASDAFTTVASSTDVPDNSIKRARKHDADLLLVRQGGRVCALSHPCAHMGGPRQECC